MTPIDPIFQQIIGQGGIAAVALFALYISRIMFERWCQLSDKLLAVVVENTKAITELTALVKDFQRREV